MKTPAHLRFALYLKADVATSPRHENSEDYTYVLKLDGLPPTLIAMARNFTSSRDLLVRGYTVGPSVSQIKGASSHDLAAFLHFLNRAQKD